MTRMEKANHDAFVKVISNRKQHDKHSLGYLIGMVKGAMSIENIYCNTFKREELLERLISLSLTERGWFILSNSPCINSAIKLELSKIKK
jgi:hypothetical protein